VASLVVGLVAAQTFVAQDSFRLSELTRTTERLEEEYGRLRVRAAELSSPDRIVAAARRAGLVLPKQVEIVRLPPVRGRGDGDVRSEAPQTLALKGVTGGGP
jgi:cell division protein FtsL